MNGQSSCVVKKNLSRVFEPKPLDARPVGHMVFFGSRTLYCYFRIRVPVTCIHLFINTQRESQDKKLKGPVTAGRARRATAAMSLTPACAHGLECRFRSTVVKESETDSLPVFKAHQTKPNQTKSRLPNPRC
jgi:hypothetical protein